MDSKGMLAGFINLIIESSPSPNTAIFRFADTGRYRLGLNSIRALIPANLQWFNRRDTPPFRVGEPSLVFCDVKISTNKALYNFIIFQLQRKIHGIVRLHDGYHSGACPKAAQTIFIVLVNDININSAIHGLYYCPFFHS